EISDTVPRLLFGDGGRIGQLLTKLITNAIAVKENADTPSELRISVSTRKDSYAQILKIAVQNLGEVLKPEELDSIHEYFSRGILRLQEREDVNEFALSIVDLFVRQMQGRITADSNEAEGTTFVIELPQLEVTES
ncbi:MAG: sensor histidine kinase, partial [Lachnospiraceae bacterium]|nr:sensor histidine kinase [Lachnospiraceae bacterium]